MWVTLLAGAYYAFPGQRVAAWALIGLSGTAAILAGLAVNRPGSRAPWLLLAGASLSLAVSQVSFLVIRDTPHTPVPVPSVRDVFALAACLLAAAGLLIFLRWRGPGQDRRGLLDALILTTALGLAAWLYLVHPYARGPGGRPRSRSSPSPIRSVMCCCSRCWPACWCPAGGRYRPWPGPSGCSPPAWAACWRPTSGSACPACTAASFLGGPGVLGWALCYAAWGAAALGPAMTGLTEPVLTEPVLTEPVLAEPVLTEPVLTEPADVTASRLVPLLLAGLLVPGVLLAAAVQRRQPDTGVIAVAAVLLDLLIVARLADAAAAHRRAACRERTLREAVASFAAATTLSEIAAATRTAATSLTGPYARTAVLAMRRGDEFIPLAPGDPYRADLDATVRDWLPTLAAPGPHLLPGATPGGRGARLAGHRHGVMLCPLPLATSGDGDAPAGVLAVFGAARTLAGLRGAVESLAGQAARAIDRIVLSQQASRRDGEAYFRTLIQDTSDVILVVADDGVVRSATPAAAHVFGDVTVVGAHLWDLVRADERDTVIDSFTRTRDQAIASAPRGWPITRTDGTRAEVEVSLTDLRHDDTVGGLLPAWR